MGVGSCTSADFGKLGMIVPPVVRRRWCRREIRLNQVSLASLLTKAKATASPFPRETSDRHAS